MREERRRPGADTAGSGEGTDEERGGDKGHGQQQEGAVVMMMCESHGAGEIGDL